jgi:hypothetical protein
MEQFKALDEDWEEVVDWSERKPVRHVYASTIRELRDRVAALEKQLRQFVPGQLVTADAPEPDVSPAAAPVAVMPSDEKLLAVCNPLVLTPEEGNRALFAYGYEQGLADGRAEQQAATEESSAAQSDPAMTALELPRDWYPDFADWLKRQMPEGTVIGDPWWWASCIADWLIAKATLGPEPNLHDIALDRVDSLGRSFHVLPEILDTLRRAIREPMVSQQAAAEPEPIPSPADGWLIAALVCIGLDDAAPYRVLSTVARWLRSKGCPTAAELLEQEANL